MVVDNPPPCDLPAVAAAASTPLVPFAAPTVTDTVASGRAVVAGARSGAGGAVADGTDADASCWKPAIVVARDA